MPKGATAHSKTVPRKHKKNEEQAGNSREFPERKTSALREQTGNVPLEENLENNDTNTRRNMRQINLKPKATEQISLSNTQSAEKEEKQKHADVKPKPAKKSSRLSTLRTYKSDIARVLAKPGQSLTRIALAEQSSRKKKGAAPYERQITIKRIIIFAASILLIVAGVGFFVWALFWEDDGKPKGEEILEQHIITFEGEREILLPRNSSRSALERAVNNELEQAVLPINHIEHVVFAIEKQGPIFTESEQEEVLKKQPIETQQLFNILRTRASGGLMRSLDEKFFYGFYGFRGNQPFLIFSVNSFGNAFAGMLTWERFIKEDLAPLLALQKDAVNDIFKDEIFKNHDTRVLRQENGEIVLLYSFVEPDTLVIARDKTILDEIITRVKFLQR